MNQKEYKRTKKLWESAADFGKVVLSITEGDSGVIFIAKNGGAAAIVLGEPQEMRNEQLVEVWKMFRNRLDDMIRHAEAGDFPAGGKGSRAFIRDNETGNYDPID